MCSESDFVDQNTYVPGIDATGIALSKQSYHQMISSCETVSPVSFAKAYNRQDVQGLILSRAQVLVLHFPRT